MSQIYRLFVLFTIFLGCATTQNNYQSRPVYPLSDAELTSLSAEERAQIPLSPEMTTRYFPDAVVYEQYETNSDPAYEEYVRVNSRKLADGGEEMPPFRIHSETKNVYVSSKVITTQTNLSECIPDTEKCRASTWLKTTVFRDQLAPISIQHLSLGTANTIVRPDGQAIAMLELTKETLVSIVVKAKQIRATGPAEGCCEKLGYSGFTNYLDEPLRGRLVDYLTDAAQVYLPYSWAKELDDALAQAVANGGASAVIAPNFSLGVNALMAIAKQASELLSGYDAEVVETHHNQKKDAPSGTAKRIGNVLGIGSEKIHSLRVGQVFGEHEIVFAANNEVVRISHAALSRACFASGALRSAAYVSGRADGLVHDFSEVVESG